MVQGIVRLLLGENVDRVGPRGEDEEAGLAERARRSGEWCGSTPGRGSVADALRSTGTSAARGKAGR